MPQKCCLRNTSKLGGPQKVVYSEFSIFTSSSDQVLDKRRVKGGIKYLLNNYFFTVRNYLFQQKISIPMGSDPAPFFANLFLHHYQRQWLLNLKKKDLAKARKFGSTFRFIEDLCAFNDGGEFEKHYREIYPEEMQLGKENKDTKKASFLDLGISIENKTSRLAGSLDVRPFFWQRNCQNTDLNNQIM